MYYFNFTNIKIYSIILMISDANNTAPQIAVMAIVDMTGLNIIIKPKIAVIIESINNISHLLPSTFFKLSDN